jgi:hypothetical protein
MANQRCGCKVKPPSTDRCGRHLNTKPKATLTGTSSLSATSAGSSPAKARAKRSTGKATQDKGAQLRLAAARHNASWVTHLRVNTFGYAVWPNTQIVIDQTKLQAVGSMVDGDKVDQIRPLTIEERQFCERVFLKPCALPVLLVGADGEPKVEVDEKKACAAEIKELGEPLEDEDESEEGEQDRDDEDDEVDEPTVLD